MQTNVKATPMERSYPHGKLLLENHWIKVDLNSYPAQIFHPTALDRANAASACIPGPGHSLPDSKQSHW